MRVRQFLTLDRKIVSRRTKSMVKAYLGGLEVRAAKVLLVEGAVAAHVLRLRSSLLGRFPWLAKFSEQSFAEICGTVLNRGKSVDVVIRGLSVERLIPDMKEMEILLGQMGKAIKGKGPGWGKPQLLSGLITPNGRQIADWVVASIHEDGRIWVMAIGESKSISNMEDLLDKNGRGAGQFLWVYLRAKGEGLVIDVVDGQGNVTKRAFDAKNVLLEPIRQGASKAPAFPTRMIAIVPEKFSQRALLNKASRDLAFEEWAWPVSQGDLLRLIEAIEKSFSR